MSKKTIQQFAHFDNNIFPFVVQEGTIITKVPPAYYHVTATPTGQIFLTKKSDKLNLPEKIYGSTNERAARMWRSYDNVSGPLAAGLFGSKGAGKTLLSNVVANQAIERGIPVIDVSSSFSTDKDYLDFLNSIGECVIIFDEFLKHLSKLGDSTEHDKREIASDRQDEMLTFFSGSNNNKRMVLLIDNESGLLSNFFRDRPGRMRYLYQYKGIESDVVQNVATDAGLSVDKVDSLVTYAKRFQCTFDTINEIVKEWVLFPNDTIESITSIMNVPSMTPDTKLKAKIVSFKHTDGDYIIENELATVSSRGTVSFTATYPNPFYGKIYSNAEEFDTDSKMDAYSYEYYLGNKDKPRLHDEFTVHDYQLVAVKGNRQAYIAQGGDLELTIELLEQEEVAPMFNFNFL
jgi:archaellum biogenesis ATPase FlaH